MRDYIITFVVWQPWFFSIHRYQDISKQNAFKTNNNTARKFLKQMISGKKVKILVTK